MRAPRANAYRDAWAGSLTGERADTTARVAGWVHRRRDHGGLIFIDLRDRSGIVQLVFHPDRAPEAHRAAHALRSEDVLTAAGTVVRREAANVNPQLPTGEIELTVDELVLHADAETPPFPIDEDGPVDELIRLRHRALDLRRRPLQEALALRHRVIAAMREVLERPRLPRDRDAEPHALDARGRTRLPRAGAHRPGVVLRAAAVAAAVQAAADDRRLRALLPDRPLLPRRGHARRSPA